MTTTTTPSGAPTLRLSARETAGVVGDVVAPLLARGVIVRRPKAEGLLDRLDADRRAITRLQDIRARHGTGPVRLSLPGREVALLLGPADVRRALDETPEPFAAATREKRGALGHFQPDGVLISHGTKRSERRGFNEAVLERDHPVHSLARDLVQSIEEEVRAMVSEARRSGALTWDEFARAWWRTVRRVVLGDGARDDDAVTDLLAALRRDANWAYLKPRRGRIRARYYERLGGHLARAERGSLAGVIASTPSSSITAPDHQVSHWLFAYDAAGMAIFRTLALLAAHPEHSARALDESAGDDLERPFLRACVLEALRLWPTTPAVLRETTAATAWEGGTLAPATALVIFAPFFHRDRERLRFADDFAPEIWLDDAQPRDWPLIPFSSGPAGCPGRNLVLLTTSAFLAALLSRTPVRGGGLGGERPLPATLSPFRLTFALGGA